MRLWGISKRLNEDKTSQKGYGKVYRPEEALSNFILFVV